MKHESLTNLINQITLPISTILLFVMGLLLAFGQTRNRPPIVSNARAEQRAGTRLVDITYDVQDPDGDAMTVSVQISDNDGSTFDMPAQTFSGDIGEGIISGVGKRIVWDAGADAPHIFGTNYVAKVIADDGIVDTSPEEIISEIDGTTMHLIPAGEFEMGDHFNEGFDQELPVHTVEVDAFYMDVTEVTNAMYAVFLNAMGKHVGDTGNVWWGRGSGNELIELVGGQYRPKAGFENHPVIEVSWYGAAAYCQWTGKRLPTEAEWEKAARGGLVGKRYLWGDNITHDDANYWGTGGRDKWSRTSPVGSFSPNGYGLYDMAGNVYEWCMDEYDSSFYATSPKNNPAAGGVISFVNNNFTNVKTQRVVRGGSWNNNDNNVRVALRGTFGPTSFFINGRVGFRCVVGASSSFPNRMN